ncbi:MAG: exo-beta-N-acetylmuramidase NamZ domain-containing protein, partial [Bacteroidota bacterium]
MSSIFKIKVLMLCMVMFFMLDEVQGKPYPSAANTWPAWKGVLEGKRVGLVIHRSSTIGGRLMPEVLLEEGVDVRMIFVPEHGLRVDFEAGATVGDHVDAVTGLPVVSLYGKRKSPETAHTDSL